MDITYNLDYVKYSQSDDEQKAEYERMLPDIGNDVEINNSKKNTKPEDGEILDVLPLRNMVLFPGVMTPVVVSRLSSKKLLRNVQKNETRIAVICQKDVKVQEPTENDLFTMGTSAKVVHITEYPTKDYVVILEGLERVRVKEFQLTKTGIKAHVISSPEIFPKRNDKQFVTLAGSMKEQAIDILNNSDNIPAQAKMTLNSIDNPPTLVNYLCVNFAPNVQAKQELLEIGILMDRALKMHELLSNEVERIRTLTQLQQETLKTMEKDQREYFLHRQMEEIQKELGDTNDQYINDLQERAKQKKWPERAQKAFDEELQKLKRMSQHSPEYSTTQTYLDTLLNLPWDEATEDNFDLSRAQQILDRDHYGMEKIKERIIEYLAVLKMKGDMKSPILCLYGPPGVGKTSLGKSIAESLDRKYCRISLGGLHDESEIRGHRRTYVGAIPGRIIENIRKAGASNPVMVLDEIDKVGADYKGDPTSALLEVLDPEQNSSFHDNYLDVEYDLSRVLFIATANSLESIPRPLLDRMELIEVTGYSTEEKIEIATRHLIPKQRKEHGLKTIDLRFNKSILKQIIEGYTRESGVRSLERKLATICRKVVTRIATEQPYNTTPSREDIITYLGQPRFSKDEWETNKYVGVVTGLAWTQVGGEILFIETSLSPAKTPTLTMTGNLGDVMKESAQIALGYIKAHADDFGIPRKAIDTQSVHIHVPEGAIPKDGPSAGITMTTALVSAYTQRKVRPRLAMTGEMTLRGKVLPIGGVKVKLLAAKRAGITDLVLCEDNRKDVAEISEQYLKGLKFHYVRDIKEVIDFAILH